MKARALLVALTVFTSFARVRAAEPISPHPAPPLEWHAWSDEIFARAKQENKFVLLDLEAVWCHWCHVMEATTYRDPRVVALLRERYLLVRVDQDSRPDLASRYEDYGWPATVIYAGDGTEIVKKQGYIEPDSMVRLLRAVIDDPSPVAAQNVSTDRSATDSPALSAERRAALRTAWLDGYDEKEGGWGSSHKFLEADAVELALREAARGDSASAKRARDTLRLQRKLIDPVWGGVYQYSAGGTWDEPHYEKIISIQADDLSTYALAYAQEGDPADLAAARKIHGYVRKFLTSPEGVVYVSQDADLVPGVHSADYFSLDDAGRRARGMPRMDSHIYARENGSFIVALAQLAAATGDAAYRVEAERAANWIVQNRSLAGGGFRHDERDSAGPYLGDTLAMGRAFLALHELTQEAGWLARAADAAQFIEAHFSRGAEAGFAASDTTKPVFPAPRPQFEENAQLARFAAALARVTGRAEFRADAASALRWLLAPEVTERRGFYLAAALLAEEDVRAEPLHVAIVGRLGDPAAAALLAAALRAPTTHRLIEWWDRSAGPAPRGEAIYPEMERAAAYVCANGACSTPMFDPAALRTRVEKILAVAK